MRKQLFDKQAVSEVFFFVVKVVFLVGFIFVLFKCFEGMSIHAEYVDWCHKQICPDGRNAQLIMGPGRCGCNQTTYVSNVAKIISREDFEFARASGWTRIPEAI